MITAFQALFQYNDPIFPPSKVRFRVGCVPNRYHYTSPLFTFENNAQDQYFSLLPDIVVGKYLKVELHGKPSVQETDNKYYIALQKVSYQGCLVDSKNISPLAFPTLQRIASNTFEYEISKARNNCKSKFHNIPIASENNSKEQISDILLEEEFTLTEDILIKLSTGNLSKTQF